MNYQVSTVDNFLSYRSSSKERKEKRDKEEKTREKTSGAEKTGDKTSNGERPIKKEKADTSIAKESSGERVTEVKKVRVKIEPEEEKAAKGKTSRDHHDGKVGNSLHIQDTCNSCSILRKQHSPKS